MKTIIKESHARPHASAHARTWRQLGVWRYGERPSHNRRYWLGGAASAKGDGTADTLFGDGGVFKTVTNILLYLIGAISVIMLIIGGIRYVVSGGDQSAVTVPKTPSHAIVGIVVAFLAFAAVNFVTTNLGNATQ